MDHAATTLSRDDLLSCIELGKALTAELDTDRLFRRILEVVSELLPAQDWSLLLADQDTRELEFRLSMDLAAETTRDLRIPFGEGVAGVSAHEQRTVVVPDVRHCEWFSGRIDASTGKETRSLICVPVLYGGRSLGVIEVINPRDLGPRTVQLLEIVANYMAIAVENASNYDRIVDLSVRDNLTGLFNTRYLHAHLDARIEVCRNRGNPLSLLFMDIDNFKRVVDTYGHLNGSQVLREFAQTLKSNITAPCFGVSYGGDEFVVVLPDFDREQAMVKGAEILQAMRETTYLAATGHAVEICASIGAATCPDDAGDARGLLALADNAMFRVKTCGKNAVEAAGAERPKG